MVIIAAILFIAGVEFWKFCKRAFFRRRASKMGGEAAADPENKMFARYLSTEKSDLSDDMEKA